MSDDLVKRLRVRAEFTGPYSALWDEAADRIEKLEALVEQLRNDNLSMIDDYDTDFLRQEKRIEKLEAALRELSTDWDCCVVSKNMKLIARKALEGKDD